MGLGKKTVDSPVKETAKSAAAAPPANDIEIPIVNESEVEPEILDNEGQEPEAAPAETAVATRKTGGLPAMKGALAEVALAHLKNKIPALDFGTLPRFKASPSGIKGDEGGLGMTCQITVVSYNDQYAVAPNEDGAPKELCKFSLDGINLTDGSGSVADHLKMLKEEGYEKAAAKRYTDLIAILNDAEKDHEEIGNMVTFSLSPMSVKSFERYQLQTTVKMSMNPAITQETAAQVTITAKPKSFSNKEFMMLDFSATK